MPHIAYSKKSFGIKNKVKWLVKIYFCQILNFQTWLRTLCLFITATILVQDLTFGIEMYATAVRGVRSATKRFEFSESRCVRVAVHIERYDK